MDEGKITHRRQAIPYLSLFNHDTISWCFGIYGYFYLSTFAVIFSLMLMFAGIFHVMFFTGFLFLLLL